MSEVSAAKSFSVPVPAVWVPKKAQTVSLALLLTLGVLILAPVAMLVYASFSTAPPGQDGAFTLANWARLFTEAESREAIKNTLLIAFYTTVFSVPIGFVFAWLEFHTDMPFARWMASLLILPLIFSGLILTIAWTLLASPGAGIVNTVIFEVTGVRRFFDIFTMTGIVVVSALYYVPIAYLVLRSSVAAIDASSIEAARIAGAGLGGATWRILVPLSTPGLAAATLLVFTQSIGVFAMATLLGPTARVPTLQLEVFYAMLESPGDPMLAATAGTFLLFLTVAGMAATRWVTRRPSRFVTITGRGFRTARSSLGHWRYVAVATVILYVLIAVVLPYLAILYASLKPFMTRAISFHDISFENLAQFVTRRDLVRAVQNTLILVVGGAALTTLIASAIAYLSRRHQSALSGLLEWTVMLSISFPLLSYSLGMLWFFLSFSAGRDYIYATLLIIYLAQLAHFLPVGVQIAGSGMAKLGDDMEDAARVCGAPFAARARRIIGPLLLPALASAWILLALHASVEAGGSMFLSVPGTRTVAVHVFTSAYNGSPNIVYGGAMVLSTFGLVVILLGNWLFGTSKFIGGGSR